MVVWEDHRFWTNGEIFAQAYLSDGTPVDDNFKVNNDIGTENQQRPSMAKDGSNNLIYVWVDERSDKSEVYAQRFSGDGTAIGNNFKVNDVSVNNTAIQPSVAASPDGNFVICWADFRNGYCLEIFAQRYTNDGTPLDSNFKVSNQDACMRLNPAIVCAQNGDFIITWNDANEGGYDITNKSFLNDGGLMEEKSSKGSEPDVYAQIYLSDGTAFGENFLVNDDITNTYQDFPAIAIDPSGNFVIAWQDTRNGPKHIYAQRYQSDGTPLGENFRAEDILYLSNQLEPSLTMDAMGNFKIAWKDFRYENFDIFCRSFSNDGTPVGNSFQVNSDTGASLQFRPRISGQDNGRFIITWTDKRNGTYDVYAQRYWSDGQPYADNFQIPNTDIMLQLYSCVILDNNRIYTTWQDNRTGQTGYDIWANILDWDVGVGISDHFIQEAVSKHLLYQNNPNPFYSFTEISYSLDESAYVNLNIYDLQGRKIKSLVDEYQFANSYSVLVDGNELVSGIYYYKLEVGNGYSEVKKMLLIR